MEQKNLPEFLSTIDFAKWRDIRFKPNEALWLREKLPFHVEFFFPGWLFNRIEKINVVESGTVKAIPFSPKLFDYGMNKFDYEALKSLGFAGLRLRYPIDTPKAYSRFALFLGASYFRAVGKNEPFRFVSPRRCHRYGPALRGGVPLFQGVLAGAPPAQSHFDHPLCAARQQLSYRRLPVRNPTGRNDIDVCHQKRSSCEKRSQN